MKRASTVVAQPQEWLIEGRIPAGKIVVIAGRPKQGKSLWTCWLAAQVSQHHPVIFSNQEDDEAIDLVPRLEFAGAKMRRIYFPTDRDFPAGFPQLPADTDRLERKIKQMRARLVIFDAALQHLQANVYNNQQARQMLTPLKAMLERTGCTAIFVDHLKKSGGRNVAHVLEAFQGGGSGLIAAARVVYAFGPNPDEPDERVLAPAGVNGGGRDSAMAYVLDTDEILLNGKRTEVARLVLTDGAAKVSAEKVIAYTGREHGGGGNPVAKAVCAEWLTGYLMWGPKDGKQVREESAKAGFSWATVRRAAKPAGVVVSTQKLPGFGTGTKSTWALKTGHPALLVAARAQAAANGGGQS